MPFNESCNESGQDMQLLTTFLIGSKNPTRSLRFIFLPLLTAFINYASAATAPDLGVNTTYGIVSSTFTNNANPTTVTGSICYTTPPVTPPTTVTGATVTPCLPSNGTDQDTALANLNGQQCVSLGLGAVALNEANVGSGPGVFTPGCYSSGGAMEVAAGAVTLNGAGVYIFRPGGAFTMAVGTSVAVGGGACENDVFWAPNAATTLGANTSLVGNILGAAGMTLGSTASLVGRILSFGGTVTTDQNTITVPSCTAFITPPTGEVTNIPSLSEWGMILLFGLMMLVVFSKTRWPKGVNPRQR